ncbi:uncharacterized protein LOC130671790 [Microplitis mediator]|uniref:uncharacterized protein LOC130671790 n=1 Tax=Microplitis mediator TaxID=375433 RepID=UPI002554F1A7|nr:uncharacterized protein LOC130671790 [Microplitis mediator]
MSRDVKSKHELEKKPIFRSANKENVFKDSVKSKKLLGAIPKQIINNDNGVEKKSRSRLLSIGNIPPRNLKIKKEINFSPSIKSAGMYSGSRFEIFNEDLMNGSVAMEIKMHKKIKEHHDNFGIVKETTEKTKLTIKKSIKNPGNGNGAGVGDKNDLIYEVDKIQFKSTPKTVAFADDCVEQGGHIGEGNNFSVKTPREKTPMPSVANANVDELTQRSKFRRVKSFFKDIEKNDPVGEDKAGDKKVLKRRASQQFLESLGYFEQKAQEGDIKGSIKNDFPGSLQAKRVMELKAEDKRAKNGTPEDTRFNLPPKEPIKVEHKKSSVATIVKKKLINSSFLNYTPDYYNKDLLKFYEEKESTRRRILFDNRRLNLSKNQRAILVKHLINVNRGFNHPTYLTYYAVRLMDDVLSLLTPIPTERLQLVELASYWIILKRDHHFHCTPLADKIVALSNGAFTVKELNEWERKILMLLSFDISYPDVSSMVVLNILSDSNLSRIGDNNIGSAYYFASYMIEVSLFDEQLMEESSILLASTIAELSVVLVMSTPYSTADISSSGWSPLYASRFREQDRMRVRSRIIQQIIKSVGGGDQEHCVYSKYKRSRYGAVSQALILHITKLLPSSDD